MQLSIIIPIYNGEKYLEACLENITNEIDSNVEVLLIDDGSNDKTYKICEKYKCENIRVFRNKNHGVSYSRNFGIKNANGNFLMFVDADDLLKKGWYSIVKKCIYDDVDICYISSKINKEFTRKEVLENIIGISNSSINFSSVWSKIFKRNFILDNNIMFSENIINGEDLLFNLETFELAKTYKVYNTGFYRYRLNYNSATHSFNDKIFISNSLFLKKFNDVIKKITWLEEIEKKRYYNFCLKNSLNIFLYRISLSKNIKK